MILKLLLLFFALAALTAVLVVAAVATTEPGQAALLAIYDHLRSRHDPGTTIDPG
jgi:hypothetical protein